MKKKKEEKTIFREERANDDTIPGSCAPLKVNRIIKIELVVSCCLYLFFFLNKLII